MRLYPFKTPKSKIRKLSKESKKTIMLIGVGEICSLLIKELQAGFHNYLKVSCIIDEDSSRHGKKLMGVPIIGGRNQIIDSVKKYNVGEIIILLSSNSDIREVLAICLKTSCFLKTISYDDYLLSGEFDLSSLHPIDIEDFILPSNKLSILNNLSDIQNTINSKVVLITGGGGSIGSELCRQISSCSPSILIIFDFNESSAYNTYMELHNKYPNLHLEIIIGSIRDENRVKQVFEKYKPDIVYHAAAYKNVPFMEDNPSEAILNNILGTFIVTKTASDCGTKSFTFISTDEALNPQNIAGLTKRIGEMIIQMFSYNSSTLFSSVRFGRVLGTDGSVISLFRKQIENGGPVILQHPSIIRYFLTIPEAVSLILKASTMSTGNDIFILNMGEPVKILDIAENIIRLSGYEPYEDIKIVFSGLRPGEKLYEELLHDKSGLIATDNDKIYISEDNKFDEKLFDEKLKILFEKAIKHSVDIRDDLNNITSEIVHENRD